jgi:hypothetical protein
MSKKEDDEKEWDPSKPLDDDEDEATVQKTARARARVKYLVDVEEKKLNKKPIKKGFLDI